MVNCLKRQFGKKPIPAAALLLPILVSAFGFWLAGPLVSEEAARFFVLDNGLKVFVLEKRNVPLVNVVAAVNLGSKDETPETSGSVHLLEHYILFRGTETRSGDEISRDIRRQGAYFNAHTGQDLAFFEISVPAAGADFALSNQKDILFHLKITREELEMEKEIVLEEFRQLEDDPFKYAASLAYQNLFRGHPYANPLIGEPESIKNMTADTLISLYRRYFVPPNCALAVVGDFSLQDMEAKVRRVFGEVRGEAPPPPDFAPAKPPDKAADIEIEMDVQKAYLVIAAPAPDFNSPEQYAMDVLTEILGRGVHPLLYSALNQGPRRLVETLRMAYQSHRYAGAVLAFLTLEPKNLGAAKREAVNYLRRTREENFSPQDIPGEAQMFAFDHLGSAKNELKYNAYQAQERGLGMAISLAQFMILREGQAESRYLESIDRVKSGDLRGVAGKYLGRADYVIVSIIPKKTK
ncbi:MAG: peptidase domain protein [Candidatus Aminicenantes bacterium]|nr:peptidase domain protein [Candidatus Aminicenantes bacterium]